MAEVHRKTSEQVGAAVIDRLVPVAGRIKTITFDNSKECSIDQSLGSMANFADQFASWQRGSNENLNGLLWEYIHS
jgi:IS30 family transposase